MFKVKKVFISDTQLAMTRVDKGLRKGKLHVKLAQGIIRKKKTQNIYIYISKKKYIYICIYTHTHIHTHTHTNKLTQIVVFCIWFSCGFIKSGGVGGGVFKKMPEVVILVR